jgi:two-component system sensor histidine kinase/response regulator
MNSARSFSILVIEDDEAVRETLADILTMNGYHAIAMPDGAAGLAAARQQPPNLIITDLAMPVLDGFGVIAACRADPELRSIPIIVITAKVDRAATRRGMELGADDFITKPFTEEEILHSIQARLEKKELIEELDAFAHTVAHDLKNPVATLGGRLELAELSLGKVDEATLRQHLTAATSAAYRLSRIIDELLILSGVRRQSVQLEPLDMGALVAETLDRIDELLRRQSAQVVLPSAWPAAVGHGPWVVEIWSNYLSNAAKYSGPQPRITLGGETCADGRRARFWVQDEGPGLDEATRQKLFVPFTRISTARAGGHGLGLSIVRRIGEKLSGRVGVDSQPGAGARFWFELPTRVPLPGSPGFPPAVP